MIHVLYLAAGSGRRFGSNKLLWNFHGKPLYRYGLERLQQFCAERTDCTLTVVTRYPEILQSCTAENCLVVESPDSIYGISHTIRAGVESLVYTPKDYFLFSVADQPCLCVQTLHKLAAAADDGALTAVAAYGERWENPVLFSAALAPELLSLQGDIGGKQVLRAHPEKRRIIQVTAERELKDIDALSDMDALL